MRSQTPAALQKPRASALSAWALALAGGAAFGMSSLCTDFGAGRLISFVFLGAALWGQRGRRCVWSTSAWALVAYGISLWWCTRFGYAPWLGLTVWYCLFLIPAALIAQYVSHGAEPLRASVALAGAITLGEWVRGLGIFGVGLATVGSPLARNLPAAQWAAVVGSIGLSFLVSVSGLSLGFGACCGGRKGRLALTVGIALLMGLEGGGALLLRRPLHPAGHIAAAATQGVTADGFHQPLPDVETLRVYLTLTKQAARSGHAALVVWPETSCPGRPFSDPQLRDGLSDTLRMLGCAALIGAIQEDWDNAHDHVRNGVMGFGRDGKVHGTYEKMRLVPFGEYVPGRRFLPSLERWRVVEQDYSPGRLRPPIPIAGAHIGVLICSESMFPDMAALRVKQGADLLAVLSNDSWFGRSFATEELARQSILRAIETGRSVIRAAETGYSMVIDPRGRVLAQSRLYQRTEVAASLPLMGGETLAVWGIYVWPAIIFVVMVLALAGDRVRAACLWCQSKASSDAARERSSRC